MTCVTCSSSLMSLAANFMATTLSLMFSPLLFIPVFLLHTLMSSGKLVNLHIFGTLILSSYLLVLNSVSLHHKYQCQKSDWSLLRNLCLLYIHHEAADSPDSLEEEYVFSRSPFCAERNLMSSCN